MILQVDTEYHVGFFDDHNQTWKQIKTNIVALDSLLSSVLAEFIGIYKQHSKGKDKYIGLQLDWYNFMQQYVVAGNKKGDAAWNMLVATVPTSNTESTRPFLFPSLMMGIFHELLERVECLVSELSATSSSSFPSATGYREDDEVSLYKLSGFALFSCIQFRQRRLMWKKKLRVSESMAERYRAELNILKQLKDSDKADVLPAIAIQDRGHMTLVNSTLIPFF